MNSTEIDALAQRFADAFSKGDVEAVVGMLADDVEIFDHVPYRFDDKTQFGEYLAGAVGAFASSGEWKIVSAHFSPLPQ